MSAPAVLLRGIGITAAKAAGVLRYHRPATKSPIQKHDVRSRAREAERLESAIAGVKKSLADLQKRAEESVGESAAEIFEIHAMLLDDEDFRGAIEQGLDAELSAEEAIEQAVRIFSNRLRQTGDDYLAARAADLTDLSRQLTEQLAEEGAEHASDPSPDQPYILVAEDLTPSETIRLDKSKILGFVTLLGTPNSHTAILARAMGIPALVGVGSLPDGCDGAYALLDAALGTLTISPSRGQILEFERRRREESELAREHDRYLRSLMNKPAVTRSGHRILIYANVGDEEEVLSAYQSGADGVGLFRSEFLYLALDRYPSEETLFASYRRAVEAMQGKRIVIRTLDVGADKQIPYFDLPHEENPALGFRAVRICLAREAMFKTQLRAILRASAHGTVSVMIPMIVSAEEIRDCRRLLEECKAELAREGIGYDAGIEFGIMIETPAAAIMSDELAAEVDFFSVGTNDLTQYTLAADRQNAALDTLCERNREPVLRLIENAARAIHERGGWIGICGELAADLCLTQRFADMKIDELSVSVPYLLGVREKVIECK